jgi:hypothetical protein
MITFTKGVDTKVKDYHQKALDNLEETKKTICESKQKLLEKLLPLCNQALG